MLPKDEYPLWVNFVTSIGRSEARRFSCAAGAEKESRTLPR